MGEVFVMKEKFEEGREQILKEEGLERGREIKCLEMEEEERETKQGEEGEDGKELS